MRKKQERKITKRELCDRLFVSYNLRVSPKQITLTKNSINNLMIVEGIGGYGFFRYGFDQYGDIRVYPNKMHSVNLNV